MPVAALVLLPLLIQIPALAGWLNPNPMPLLSGLGIIPHPPLIAGFPGWLDPNVGTNNQALGPLIATDWMQGVVPWWNPYSGVGMPLAAQMHPAALFLPFVLLLRFAAGVLLLKIVLQAIAGVATWALLRELDASALAAFAGGVVFEFNGTFAWLAHAPIFPIAFLPLLLLGVEHARRRGGVALTALSLGAMLVAGFPETAYIQGLLAAAWAGLRLVRAAPRSRLGFAIRVGCGGVAGLLLAAPVLWAFIHLLMHGDAGAHSAHIGHPAIPPVGLGMLLFPYLYGSLFGQSVDVPGLWTLWAGAGGYLSLPLLAIAVAGCVGKRERPIRLLLAGWMLVCLARSFGVPVLTEAVDSLPLLGLSWFFRYAPPSWALSAAILAALAMDDLCRSGHTSVRALLAAIGLATCAAVGALLASRPLLSALLLTHAATERGWIAFSLGWGVVALTGLALAAWRGRIRMVAAVMAVNALTLFAVPLLSGLHGARVDRAPIDFLRARLALQRFYTLGPLQPNYGALFRIASINHNSLPVPRNWVRYIRDRLDRHAALLPAVFTGSEPRGSASAPDQSAELRAHRAAYEALGVRYVLFPPGRDPFGFNMATETSEIGNIPRPLHAGEAMSGTLPGALVTGGTITRATVMIGTYTGHANGRLGVTLCTAAVCASGTADLAHAADNAPLAVDLAPPLVMTAGQSIRWQITHLDGNSPVAVWLWPARHNPHQLVPRLALHVPLVGGIRRVFTDNLVAIDELPNPAPYFEASGCTLRTIGRTRVRANCPTPARLIRRELFFPGWRARVNGKHVPISQFGDLFQTIDLPAGRSDVRFAFAPPGILWAWIAASLGATLLVAAQAAASSARRSARLRVCGSRCRLRSRTAPGVTSTSSSSST